MRSAKDTMTSPTDTVENLHAILFDVFGTVVDWRSSVAREVTAAAACYDLSVDASFGGEAIAQKVVCVLAVEVRNHKAVGQLPTHRLVESDQNN